jgi:hypothetical protein
MECEKSCLKKRVLRVVWIGANNDTLACPGGVKGDFDNELEMPIRGNNEVNSVVSRASVRGISEVRESYGVELEVRKELKSSFMELSSGRGLL